MFCGAQGKKSNMVSTLKDFTQSKAGNKTGQNGYTYSIGDTPCCKKLQRMRGLSYWPLTEVRGLNSFAANSIAIFGATPDARVFLMGW